MKAVSTKIFAIRCAISMAAAFNFNAHADLLSDCLATVEPINKSAPITVDQVTTLFNAMCSLDGQIVTMVYREKLSGQPGAVNQAKINSNLRPRFIQMWCTNPDQIKTLSFFNVQYNYVDVAGNYIGKLDISKRDCKN